MSQNFKNIIDLGGLRTNAPEDKIPDRHSTECRNIDFSLAGMIQTKEGYGLIGNENTGGGNCSRTFTFRKAFGTIIKVLVRVRDNGTNTILEWLNTANTNYEEGKWEPLVSTFTTGKIMDFEVANGNDGELVNLLVFCNGVDNLSSWNGATASVASVTSNSIVCNETLSTEGFTTTGSVLIDGTEYAYTGLSSKTFTGVTPDPTTQNPDANSGVAQKPDTTTHSALDKGNILLVTQGKLFISGIQNNGSIVTYSASGDVFDFTSTPGGLGDAGDFYVLDNGGKINNMSAYGKNGLMIHKDNAVVRYTRDIDPSGSVMESYDVLSSSEDSGSSNVKADTSINRDNFFVTEFEGLKQLSKTVKGDETQISSITSLILPTIENWDMGQSSVIYYPNKRAIMFSADNSDGERKTVSYYLNTGDFSIDDIPADDFAFKDRGLYFGDAYSQNVYKMGLQKSANGSPIEHVWVSKAFNFNEPATDKPFNLCYVEGLIGSYTKIKITIFYGQYGNEGEKSQILDWNNPKYVATQPLSALGTEVLGTVSLGAISKDIRDSYAFSIPIHLDEIRSNKYKIKIETYYDDETQPDYEVYWAVTSISTNPRLATLNQNNIVNSNE